jgi:ubiquinone/menaquinone biosynthesis C-methylase UbiE
MSYDKYERYGAYHWPPVAPGMRFWKYEPQADANYRIAYQELRRRLPPTNGARPRILDIACGDGVMTYQMRRAGLSVVGLDLELLSLQLARRELAKRNVGAPRLVRGSCMALPFADATFDGAVAMELIEHLDPMLNTTFISEIRRILKPGGVVAVTTPHKQTPELRSEYHTQEFSGAELGRLLARSFRDVEVFAYYRDALQQSYARGGMLRPLRLAWKVLWRVPALNPFMETTSSPSPEWEHIIGVGRVERSA